MPRTDNRSARPRSAKRQPQGIQSVEIGMRVLNVLATSGHPLALREIGAAAGLSASQTHRYLVSLTRAGLAAPSDGNGRYRLGAAALRVGLAALAQQDEIETAGEALRKLVSRTRQTGMLSIWGPAGATCVRYFRGETLLGTDVGLGSIFPLVTTATGRIFLAWLDPALTREALALEIKRMRSDLDPKEIPDPEQIVEATRRAGYAEVSGHFVSNIGAVAAPIFDLQKQLVAVTCLVVRGSQLKRDHDQLVAALMASAREAQELSGG